MGKSLTFTHRIEVKENAGKGVVSPMGWRSKESGRPTKENLEKWVEMYHTALKPGGSNDHLAKHLGYMPTLCSAKVIRQSTGEVVCEWNAPAFMVV